MVINIMLLWSFRSHSDPLGGYSTKPICCQNDRRLEYLRTKVIVIGSPQIYLPEPGALQECEGAAQQLQNDVTSMEGLETGN